jgi:cation transporter-like permease
MRRFLAALLGLLIGYPVFAVLGYFAISLFSGNHFDGSVEASMTAAFVFGPACAIIGLIAGIIVGKKKPTLDGASR